MSVYQELKEFELLLTLSVQCELLHACHVHLDVALVCEQIRRGALSAVGAARCALRTVLCWNWRALLGGLKMITSKFELTY
jgi:hypothetical protein